MTYPFPKGIRPNPLTHSLFSQISDDGAAISPGDSQFITTEDSIFITTENSLRLITEG